MKENLDKISGLIPKCIKENMKSLRNPNYLKKFFYNLF